MPHQQIDNYIARHILFIDTGTTSIMASASSAASLPSLSHMQDCTQQVFGCQPCLWQLTVVKTVLKYNCDIISIAGTGMDKTLTFWMPQLFCPPGSIQIIITPLNILGKQNMQVLEKAGFHGIFISADTATGENFHVSYHAVMRSFHWRELS